MVSQAWLAKNSAHDAFAFWQPLDAQFLTLTARFARQNQIGFVSFSQPHYFFAYLDYDATATLTTQDQAQLVHLATLDQIRANQINVTGLTFQKLATGK
jgi:hypothetical protein